METNKTTTPKTKMILLPLQLAATQTNAPIRRTTGIKAGRIHKTHAINGFACGVIIPRKKRVYQYRDSRLSATSAILTKKVSPKRAIQPAYGMAQKEVYFSIVIHTHDTSDIAIHTHTLFGHEKKLSEVQRKWKKHQK